MYRPPFDSIRARVTERLDCDGTTRGYLEPYLMAIEQAMPINGSMSVASTSTTRGWPSQMSVMDRRNHNQPQ